MFKKIISIIFIIIFSTVITSHATDLKSTETSDPVSVAIAITQEGLFPQQIYIPADQKSQLYILAKFSGTFRIGKNTDPVACQKNKLQLIQLPDLTEETITFTYNAKKEETILTGKILAMPIPEDEMINVVILGATKKFLPKTTIIPENRPFKLHTMSARSFPHKDFSLLGADIDLQFKKGRIVTVEVENGLKSGTYLISRPKYPKQKHGIATKIVVIPGEPSK